MFSWLTGGVDSESSEEEEEITTSNNNSKCPKSVPNATDENKTSHYHPLYEDQILPPTKKNYPLHYSILSKDLSTLKKHLISIQKKEKGQDPLILHKYKKINQLDHHGYTPLHLCVLTSWEPGLDLLLQYNASPDVRSRGGWTSIQEAVSTSQQTILKKLFIQNMKQVTDGMEIRGPIIRQKLKERKDFYIEIDWKFSSWIPFVSRFCPHDTFKIWKHGSDFRIDITLIDFNNFKWERGNISLLFKMNQKTNKIELYVLNHVTKTKQITSKDKEFSMFTNNNVCTDEKNSKEINEQIELLMQAELVSPKLLIDNIKIEKMKTWLGYEKELEINDVIADCYQLTNVQLSSCKRNSHVPTEVQNERENTAKLIKSQLSPQVSVDDDNQEEFDIEFMDDENKIKETDTSQHNDHNNLDEPKETKISDEKECKESDGIFGKIKYYKYKDYKPPKIDIEKYFNMNEWDKRQNLLNHQKKHNEIDKSRLKVDKNNPKKTRILVERGKETFTINDALTTKHSKKFKLNLFMIQEFGLRLDEIIVILEAAAKGSNLVERLKEFLQMEMPPGFPIRLELPLYHVLKATVTFQNFKEYDIDPKIFEVPQDYKLVVENTKKN